MLFLLDQACLDLDFSRRYAGVAYSADDLDITLGDIPLMQKGQPLEFDAKAASRYLTDVTARHGTVYITLSLGSGPGEGTAWVSAFFVSPYLALNLMTNSPQLLNNLA